MNATFAYPLVVALLATFALWMAHHAYVAARRRKQARVAEAKRWFLAEGQFKDSNPVEMAMLYQYALQRSCQGEVLSALERIRLAYGSPPKNGHMYWLRLQCDRRIPFSQLAPRCIPGQGVADHPSWPNEAG